LRKDEFLSFWDGMRQTHPSGSHDLQMLADLRWSLGLPPMGAPPEESYYMD